jgi:hypothetical protein
MNKILNISYYVSMSILMCGILLFLTLSLRHIIGIEYEDLGGGYHCLIEIPRVDIPVTIVGVFTFIFSVCYYPLLLIFLIAFLIIRNKTNSNKAILAVSIKKHFIICLITFLIGFLILIMSSYLWDISSGCD